MVKKQTSDLPDMVILLHLCHKVLFVMSEMAGHTHNRAQSLRRICPHSSCGCWIVAGATCTSISVYSPLWWNDGCLHLNPFGTWSIRWLWRLGYLLTLKIYTYQAGKINIFFRLLGRDAWRTNMVCTKGMRPRLIKSSKAPLWYQPPPQKVFHQNTGPHLSVVT